MYWQVPWLYSYLYSYLYQIHVHVNLPICLRATQHQPINQLCCQLVFKCRRCFFAALSQKRGLVRIHPKVDIWYMIKISASYNLLWIQFNQFSVQSFQKSGAGPNEKIGLKKKTRSLETKDLNLIHICEAFFYQH